MSTLTYPIQSIPALPAGFAATRVTTPAVLNPKDPGQSLSFHAVLSLTIPGHPAPQLLGSSIIVAGGGTAQNTNISFLWGALTAA